MPRKRPGPTVGLRLLSGGVSLNKASSTTLLPVRLQWAAERHEGTALLDSGAEGNLLDISLAQLLHIPLVPLRHKISVSALMDSHFLRSVSPRYPSPSSPQATTQRPSRSSSPTHPWPRWCWVTPGSHSTILGWIGVGTPCRSGVEPAMPLVLCLLVFLCVILCCRRRWGTCLTCPRSIST